MEEILKMIRKENLGNQFIKIEFCGNVDNALSDYYFVVSKEDKERLIDFLGPRSESERKSIENNIQNGTIKDHILMELDSTFESITSHFIDIYGGIDELLMHYGYLESNMDASDFYSEASLFDSFNNDTMEIMEDLNEEEEEEVVQEPETLKINLQDETVLVPKQTPKPEVEMTSTDSELIFEIVKIAIEKLGFNFEDIKVKAQSRIDARRNPIITEDEMISALNQLVALGKYSEQDKSFIISSYRAGNELEVTNLLGSKCTEVMNNGR